MLSKPIEYFHPFFKVASGVKGTKSKMWEVRKHKFSLSTSLWLSKLPTSMYVFIREPLLHPKCEKWESVNCLLTSHISLHCTHMYIPAFMNQYFIQKMRTKNAYNVIVSLPHHYIQPATTLPAHFILRASVNHYCICELVKTIIVFWYGTYITTFR